MKKIIYLFLISMLSLSTQGSDMEKFFSKEIGLPVDDYLSLNKDYLFNNDEVINKLTKIDSVDYDVSSTPGFLSRYIIDEFKWSPAGPELREIFKSSVYTLGWISFTSKYKGYIISSDSFSDYQIDLWIFDENIPKNHICLFRAYKNDRPENLDNMTIEVDSKIQKNKTIEWHWDNYGLHTYITFKLNKNGQFEDVETRTEGTYNGPYSESDYEDGF